MTDTKPVRPGKDASAREVWEHACFILGSGDCDGWADLLSEDVLLEWPFASPDLPRQMHGREEVRRLLTPVQAVAIGSIAKRENNTAVVHETTDPEVLIAELNADVTLENGETFHNTLVHVVRVRDGEIVHFTDYFNSANASPGYSASLEPLRGLGTAS
jgi:ketosteroid isomerase-like protein